MNEFKCQDALSYVKGLQDESVHLVLTDPPFAISRKTGFASGENTGKDTDRFRVSYEFGDWDVVDLDYFHALFTEAYRKLVKGGTMVVFYDLWKIQELKELLESIGFRMFRMIEWLKTNPVPINSSKNYLTNSRELAIVCVKGSKPVFNSQYNRGVFEYPIYQGKDRFHPTQKSLQLFQELVNIHSNEGDVVLDFFGGSGTTQVAAYLEGRQYLGCEKDESTYLKTKERLKTYEQHRENCTST